MSKQTETKGKDKVQVGPRFVDHCSYKGRGKGLGLRADARELSRRRWVTQFWGGLLSKLHIFARGTQYCNENMIIYCTHTVRSYCTYYYILPFLLFSISSAVLDDPAFARSWGGGCSMQLHSSGGKGNPNSSCSQGVELLQGAELWEFTSCSLIFFLAILLPSLRHNSSVQSESSSAGHPWSFALSLCLCEFVYLYLCICVLK